MNSTSPSAIRSSSTSGRRIARRRSPQGSADRPSLVQRRVRGSVEAHGRPVLRQRSERQRRRRLDRWYRTMPVWAEMIENTRVLGTGRIHQLFPTGSSGVNALPASSRSACTGRATPPRSRPIGGPALELGAPGGFAPGACSAPRPARRTRDRPRDDVRCAVDGEPIVLGTTPAPGARSHRVDDLHPGRVHRGVRRARHRQRASFTTCHHDHAAPAATRSGRRVPDRCPGAAGQSASLTLTIVAAPIIS